MLRKLCVSAVAVSCAVSASLSAFAAEPVGFMESFSGQTFIKHDGVIYSAAPRAALYLGDEVVTVNGSSAVVQLNAGCNLALSENSLVLLTSPEQCTGATNVIPLEGNSPYYGYTFSHANGALTQGRQAMTSGLESGTGALIPIGLATGAGLIAVAATSSKDETVNSSP